MLARTNECANYKMTRVFGCFFAHHHRRRQLSLQLFVLSSHCMRAHDSIVFICLLSACRAQAIRLLERMLMLVLLAAIAHGARVALICQTHGVLSRPTQQTTMNPHVTESCEHRSSVLFLAAAAWRLLHCLGASLLVGARGRYVSSVRVCNVPGRWCWSRAGGTAGTHAHRARRSAECSRARSNNA